MATQLDSSAARRFRQALVLWAAFFTLNVILNGTIPFILGADLHAWTSSTAKAILSPLLIYGILFLVVPHSGQGSDSATGLPISLILAVVAISLWFVFRGIGAIAVLVLAYLHWRFDLSELGFRSRGWGGDLTAIILPGLLTAAAGVLQAGGWSPEPGKALLSALDRLFANPASSVENLFYFGFVAERLSLKTGRWFTPILIALMYTAHEMSNPEYWYKSMSFGFVFVGVVLITALYLWRRNVVAIWLSDGLLVSHGLI
jgi:hypothetical protein